MSVEIQFDRLEKTYNPGDTVRGQVVITSPQGSLKHSAIKLHVEGKVTLQLSARSIGLLEAFYSSLQPVQLLDFDLVVSSGGKCQPGQTEYPFQFVLAPSTSSQSLYDTYHGVYVNVQYTASVEVERGLMSKNLLNNKEFIVELLADEELKRSQQKAEQFKFKIAPSSLQNVKASSRSKIPEFKFEGYLDHTTCSINESFSGKLVIKKCAVDIKSIELQLVRVESCTYMEGEAREATEIQNIQIADGNIVRDLALPIYMVFPRLFTCTTAISKSFKIEFEVNLIVLFADNHMVTENFPIKIFRGS